ncbi:hypothetical protein ACSFBX_03740 [Variovorax sp. RB2P76]|uniref:hypothetical protein n=1 Tax=Variovorax sp. RB2P76 TaxID=3443736 RepID=UPI003F4614A3
MRYLVCTADVDPCPPGNVASIPFLETIDFASMGITPETVFFVFGWGFAAVFTFWLLGFGTAIAISMIRKL